MLYFYPEAESLINDDKTNAEFNANLELLEEPVLAKETAANVEVLLDTKVDSAESRGTQADCCFEYTVQKKNAATQTNPTYTRDRNTSTKDLRIRTHKSEGVQTIIRKQNSNKATQSCSTIISKLAQKSTSEKKCEQNSLDEIFEDSPMNSSFNSPSFSGFDGFELSELFVRGCDDMAKDVNNSFANDKSLNDDTVNNEFVNSTAVHNEIVDNNNGDSLKNKFLNKIFPIGGNARSDSANTEITVSIESFGNITHNSHDTGIVMDDSFVSVEGPIDPNDISANESEDISETEDFRFSRPIEEERTFLVYEKNLYELLAHCPRIGSPVDRSLINEVKNTGAQLHLRITCSRECDTEWRSQPLVENFKGLGKLFATSSIAFSDIPFSKFERFAKFMNLKSISGTLFYQLRRDVLFTVVVKKWKQQRKRMLQLLK